MRKRFLATCVLTCLALWLAFASPTHANGPVETVTPTPVPTETPGTNPVVPFYWNGLSADRDICFPHASTASRNATQAHGGSTITSVSGNLVNGNCEFKVAFADGHTESVTIPIPPPTAKPQTNALVWIGASTVIIGLALLIRFTTNNIGSKRTASANA